MKVFAMWYGGCGYSTPNQHDRRDVEAFESIEAAVECFDDRYHNRRHPDTPCVDQATTEMWLFIGYDPYEDGDCYPDRIVKYGPKGGIRVEHV